MAHFIAKSSYGFSQPPVAWIGGAVLADLIQAARAAALSVSALVESKTVPVQRSPRFVMSSTNVVAASPLANIVVAGIVDPGFDSACIVSEAVATKTRAAKNFVQVALIIVGCAALPGSTIPATV
jgi:hypothetical protein